MIEKYQCADCDYEFVTEKVGDGPRCPKCTRTEAVKPADDSALQSDLWRQWLVVFGLLLVGAVTYMIVR